MRRLRPLIYLLIALGVLAVGGLSVYQLAFLRSAGEANAPGSMQVGRSIEYPNLPDRRGIFISSTRSPSGFEELLQVNEDAPQLYMYTVPREAARYKPGEVSWIMNVAAGLEFDAARYRIYKLNPNADGSELVPLKFEVVQRDKREKAVRFMAASGGWEQGAYLIDTPNDSMGGGRIYAYFIVGNPQVTYGNSK